MQCSASTRLGSSRGCTAVHGKRLPRWRRRSGRLSVRGLQRRSRLFLPGGQRTDTSGGLLLLELTRRRGPELRLTSCKPTGVRPGRWIFAPPSQARSSRCTGYRHTGGVACGGRLRAALWDRLANRRAVEANHAARASCGVSNSSHSGRMTNDESHISLLLWLLTCSAARSRAPVGAPQSRLHLRQHPRALRRRPPALWPTAPTRSCTWRGCSDEARPRGARWSRCCAPSA